MLDNALRAVASEFDLVAPVGTRRLSELMAKAETSADLPADIEQSALLLYEHYEKITENTVSWDVQIRVHSKSDAPVRRP